MNKHFEQLQPTACFEYTSAPQKDMLEEWKEWREYDNDEELMEIMTFDNRSIYINKNDEHPLDWLKQKCNRRE